MIVQPDRKNRNETELFYENEARRIAMLNEIQRMQSGGNCRPVRRAGKAPGRAQRQLLMDGTAVESAFALLSTKVTKLMRRIRR